MEGDLRFISFPLSPLRIGWSTVASFSPPFFPSSLALRSDGSRHVHGLWSFLFGLLLQGQKFFPLFPFPLAIGLGNMMVGWLFSSFFSLKINGQTHFSSFFFVIYGFPPPPPPPFSPKFSRVQLYPFFFFFSCVDANIPAHLNFFFQAEGSDLSLSFPSFHSKQLYEWLRSVFTLFPPPLRPTSWDKYPFLPISFFSFARFAWLWEAPWRKVRRQKFSTLSSPPSPPF